MSNSVRPHRWQPTVSSAPGIPQARIPKGYLVFPILLFSSIILQYSLKEPSSSLLVILENSAFRWICLSFSPLPFPFLLFSAVLRPSQTIILPLGHFFFLGIDFGQPLLYNITSVHSSPGILSGLITHIYLSPLPYNHKGFDLGHT